MKRKIAFVIPKLGGGGAERVVLTILRYIDKNKFDVHLILIHETGDYMNDIPREVNIHVLKTKKLRYSAFELISVIRKLNPNIIFSTIRGMSILIGLIRPFISKDIKVVFREMNTPSQSIKYTSSLGLLKIVYKTVYKQADKIVCQSNYMKKDFIEYLGYKEEKLVQIYNPLDINMIDSMIMNTDSPFPNRNVRNIISVGRLSEQKNFEVLIDSLSEFNNKNENIVVWVLGDGPKKKELISYAREKKVDDIIKFVGRKKNPYRWMKHADLFILHSNYEGLPNVLIEAIACGCPPIVTIHPGGTKEIMKIAGLEDRIVSKLNWDEKWFDKIQFKQVDKIRKEFSVLTIIKDYEKLFIEIIGNN